MYKILSAVAVIFFTTGCVTEPNPHTISSVPASDENFRIATKAANVCAQHMPNIKAVQSSLQSIGFTNPSDARLIQSLPQSAGQLLEAGSGKVLVQIAQRRDSRVCIVGLENMTLDQSYRLALPWVKKYQALTNEERGQGLSPKVVQAWARFNETFNVYISANKNWELWDALDTVGSSIRLIYCTKEPGKTCR